MKQSNDRFDILQDEHLAEFVDQVMKGTMKQVESNIDDELRGLEKTILRLNQSVPPVSLDEATLKQMQVRLHARIRREAQETKQSFWKKWFSSQAHLQFGIGFVAVALLITLAILSTSYANPGSSITATALSPGKNILIMGILAGVILIILWIKRPK